MEEKYKAVTAMFLYSGVSGMFAPVPEVARSEQILLPHQALQDLQKECVAADFRMWPETGLSRPRAVAATHVATV